MPPVTVPEAQGRTEAGRMEKVARDARGSARGSQPAHWTMFSLIACGSGKVRYLSL